MSRGSRWWGCAWQLAIGRDEIVYKNWRNCFWNLRSGKSSAWTLHINIFQFYLIWFRLMLYFSLANNRFVSPFEWMTVCLSNVPSVCLTFSWNVGQSMSSCFNIAHSIWKPNIATLYKRTLYICMCKSVYEQIEHHSWITDSL